MSELIGPYMNTIIWALIVLVGVYLFFAIYRFYRIIEQDRNYVEYNENTGVLKKGHPRPRWDYSLFSGFSKLFHRSSLGTLLAFVLFTFVFTVSLLTKEDWLRDIVKVNFGVIIGTIITGK